MRQSALLVLASLAGCSLGTDFDRGYSAEYKPFNVDVYSDWIDDVQLDPADAAPCLEACEDLERCIGEGCFDDLIAVQRCAEVCLEDEAPFLEPDAIKQCDPELVAAVQDSFCSEELDCASVCSALASSCRPALSESCEVRQNWEPICVRVCNNRSAIRDCLAGVVTVDGAGEVADALMCPETTGCFFLDGEGSRLCTEAPGTPQ